MNFYLHLSARNAFLPIFTSFLFKLCLVKKDFSDPKIRQITLTDILTTLLFS